jgi:dihydrofolate synthase/folylpolyglutamate synthase
VPVPGTLTARCEALLAPRIEARIVPGLDRIRGVLDTLGCPELAFPSALVVGTNGKGSSAALLASILSAHGVRVGLYTSPHLVSVRERIRIGDRPLTASNLLRHLRELAAFADLSYFETLTAAAILEFAEQAVDAAVLEAGIGGRWDATRVAGAVVTLLTNVGTDHQSWLGGSRVEIAAEKAAALSGKEALIGEWDDEVEAAIRAAADPWTPLSLASDWAIVAELRSAGAGHRRAGQGGERRGKRADLSREARSGEPGAPAATGTPVTFSVAGVTGDAVLPLLGGHQLANLRLALAGAAALVRHVQLPPLDATALATGIQATCWPGRLQWHTWRGRTLLLDGAHNLEATTALAQALDELALSGRIDLLFSCLADKPVAAMAELLGSRVRRVVVAPLRSPRATSAAALVTAFPGAVETEDVASALGRLPAGSVTLVTGSLHLVGEVLGLTGGIGV